MSLSDRILIGILVLLAGGVRAFFGLYTGSQYDDAFITYRYAENLASGLGFVYNAGERVLGTTTPLFTLLLAFFRLIGFSPVIVSPVLNVLADSLTTGLLFIIVRLKLYESYSERWLDTTGSLPYYNSSLIAFVSAGTYALFTRNIAWSVSGMETSLYTLAIILTFFVYLQEKELLSFFLSGILVLLRVDGILVGLALIADSLLRGRRLPWHGILIWFLVVEPWLVFATAYFGSPIPSSISAKQALYTGPWATEPIEVFKRFLLFDHLKTLAYPIVVLVLMGVVTVLRSRRQFLVIMIWLGLYIGFFSFSQTHIFTWYLVPIYPFYLTFLMVGLFTVLKEALNIVQRLIRGNELADFAQDKWSQTGSKSPSENLCQIEVERGVKIISQKRYWGSTPWAFNVIGAFILLTVFMLSLRPAAKSLDHLIYLQGVMDQVHKSIGLWMKENTSPEDLICAEDIGYMGYYSGRRILDRDGLISPEAIGFNQAHNPVGLIQKYSPLVCIVANYGPNTAEMLSNDWFLKHYRLIKQFSFVVTDSLCARLFYPARETGSTVYFVFQKKQG